MLRSTLYAAIAIAGLALAGPLPAAAQENAGVGNVTDPATGYPCLDPSCNAVRLPGTECVCWRIGPYFIESRKNRLECRIIGFGSRRACPQQPK